MKMEKTKDFIFIKEWRKTNRRMLKRLHPEMSKKQINEFLDDLIRERIRNPKCEIDNNYAHVNIKSTLLEIYDWIKLTKPVCGGFGVFYKNQNDVKNPLAIMIEKFLTSRKKFKARLKDFKDVECYEYKTFDRKQLSEKQNTNSIYGTYGNVISFLYNKYTAPSVTGTGQSLISTTELAFEAFLANNVAFNNLNEFMTFIDNITTEKYKHDTSMLPDIPLEKVMLRMIDMFYDYKDSYEELIYETLSSLSQDELNKVYFKNNIYELSLLPELKSLLYLVFNNCDNFKDPNKVPSEIQEYLDELWEYYSDFTLYNYSPINRIQRLKNDKRKCTITIDTDSNMLNLNPWVEFINSNILDDDILSRMSIDSTYKEEVRFIAINTLAFITTKMITAVLSRYTDDANVLEEYKPKINMKNEYLFSRMILASKKKKYVSSIRLREGSEIYPEKTDTKGMEFMKSTATEETKQRFENIVKTRILHTKEIEIAKVLQDLEEFEAEIIKSIKDGDKTYLIPKSVKELGAYQDPLREQGVRAVIAWNYLYPDMSIELPAKIDIVKLNLTQEKEFDKLRIKDKKIYDIVEKHILNNPDERISKKGLPVIAIPKNVNTVPEWMLEFIDYDTLTFNVLKKFYPILESLGLETIKTSKKEYFSNIINL